MTLDVFYAIIIPISLRREQAWTPAHARLPSPSRTDKLGGGPHKVFFLCAFIET